jgi:hypothetical protein
MLRIDRTQNTLQPLPSRSLTEAALLERQHLQEFIFNSSQAFFGDTGHQLFLLGKEVRPSEVVDDRIDLLGIAPDGTAVIVELKRGNDKFQLLQALSYAAMVSKWRPEDFRTLLAEERANDLQEFLETGNLDDLNRAQRVLLVAEAFDYEVLVTAEWLAEQYNVDVVCIRISLAADEGSGAEYLSCSQIYPAPELEDQAIRRRAAVRMNPVASHNLSQALSECRNASAVTFFQQQIDQGVPKDGKNRNLHYRIGQRIRWYVAVRKNCAYVWQSGRFEGDEDYWREGLSRPETVAPVCEDQPTRCLRFHLFSDSDFSFFLKTYQQQAASLVWEGPRSTAAPTSETGPGQE